MSLEKLGFKVKRTYFYRKSLDGVYRIFERMDIVKPHMKIRDMGYELLEESTAKAFVEAIIEDEELREY